jgi:osmoprotectant transport system permease protein
LMKLLEFFLRNRSEVTGLALEHMFLVVVATGAAAMVGIPLGILLARRPLFAKPVLATANVVQTIPSLALFGFLIPILGRYGIGRLPAIIALFLYSLLPIIRNTFAGINGVDRSVIEAARGMGMTGWQMLVRVELPLAISVIIAGLRVATVISVGTATIAAAIGAGGLGMYIFRGLRMNDDVLILAGAVPAAIMALLADFLMGLAERALAPGRPRKRIMLAAAAGALILILCFALTSSRPGPRRIVVGSKDFTEQVILGELVAQALERAGLQVERQFELGGDLCHRFMLEGRIDLYVEYTGTAFTAILKHEPIADTRQVYDRVKSEYSSRWGLEWLKPLGFNNTFAILVRAEVARRLNLKTISDAARFAPQWRAGFGQDFMSRQDGYAGFVRAYGLRFAEQPREMDLSLTYRALAAGQVDIIAGNSTDALIEELGLYQLEDDKRYFPPYEAAPVVRKQILEEYPQVERALEVLAGKINDLQMRRLNYMVDVQKRDFREVAREFLAGLEL